MKMEKKIQPLTHITHEDPGSYDTQMRVFHEQMKYMDSMQRANRASEANTNITNPNAYAKEFNPQKDTSFKPLAISAGMAVRESEFNTVRNFETIMII